MRNNTPNINFTDAHSEYHSYIALKDIKVGDIPETFRFEGYNLEVKREFHISLVWASKVARLIDESREEELIDEIHQAFKDFHAQKPVVEFKLLPELRFLEKGEQKTIIVMAEVEHLEEFFNEVRGRYQTEIPSQPTHVTLYTLPPDRIGVGIFDEKQLEEQTKVVVLPELMDKLTIEDENS